MRNHLYDELLQQDLVEYRKLLRVPGDVFFVLLNRILHQIQKAYTNMRRSILARRLDCR